MANTPTPQMATIEETAIHYKVSERTIHRLIADGTLKPFRIGSKIIRLDLNDSDRVFQAGANHA